MISVLSAISTGASHIEKNLVCQDSMRYTSVNFCGRQLIIAAVADGVGSCIMSDIGSKCAVEASVAAVERDIQKLDGWNSNLIEDIIYNAFNEAYDSIEKIADESERTMFSYSTTLTLAVYDGERLSFGHIGDSGIIALYEDGTYEMITKRHKGEEANSVIPLNGGYKLWMFGSAKKPVVSIALMTDGILDCGVQSEALDNLVYFPMYGEYMLKPVSDSQQEKEISAQLYNWITGSQFTSKVTDDVTLIVASNQNKIKYAMDNLAWDAEKWFAKVNEAQKKREASLYVDYENAKKQRKLGVQKKTPAKNKPYEQEQKTGIYRYGEESRTAPENRENNRCVHQQSEQRAQNGQRIPQSNGQFRGNDNAPKYMTWQEKTAVQAEKTAFNDKNTDSNNKPEEVTIEELFGMLDNMDKRISSEVNKVTKKAAMLIDNGAQKTAEFVQDKANKISEVARKFVDSNNSGQNNQ